MEIKQFFGMLDMQDFIKMQQSNQHLFFVNPNSSTPKMFFPLPRVNIITFKVNKQIFKIQVNSYML